MFEESGDDGGGGILVLGNRNETMNKEREARGKCAGSLWAYTFFITIRPAFILTVFLVNSLWVLYVRLLLTLLVWVVKEIAREKAFYIFLRKCWALWNPFGIACFDGDEKACWIASSFLLERKEYFLFGNGRWDDGRKDDMAWFAWHDKTDDEMSFFLEFWWNYKFSFCEKKKWDDIFRLHFFWSSFWKRG